MPLPFGVVPFVPDPPPGNMLLGVPSADWSTKRHFAYDQTPSDRQRIARNDRKRVSTGTIVVVGDRYKHGRQRERYRRFAFLDSTRPRVAVLACTHTKGEAPTHEILGTQRVPRLTCRRLVVVFAFLEEDNKGQK